MVYKIFIKEINIFTRGPECDDITRSLRINRLACSSWRSHLQACGPTKTQTHRVKYLFGFQMPGCEAGLRSPALGAGSPLQSIPLGGIGAGRGGAAASQALQMVPLISLQRSTQPSGGGFGWHSDKMLS